MFIIDYHIFKNILRMGLGNHVLILSNSLPQIHIPVMGALRPLKVGPSLDSWSWVLKESRFSLLQSRPEPATSARTGQKQ